MELHLITGQTDHRPQDAVRFLLDTNVAAPFLRWMALDSRPPEAAVVDAFAWLQARVRTSMVASALGQSRPLTVEMRWAAIETSRHAGVIDGKRLALMDAAQDLLVDWLASAEPISRRVQTSPPRLRVRRHVALVSDGTADDVYHLGVSVCLVRLAKLHRRRLAGDLRRPSDRMDALEEWAESVQSVGGMSSHVLVAAVQTALAGDGSPARAMCKFSEYRDRDSAVKAAANASWDMLFLRMLHASELGLTPYAALNGPTTLLTFDRQFAESAKGVIGVFLGAGTNDFRLPGSVARLRQHLQKDVSSDPRMLARLDEVAQRLRSQQHERLSKPRMDASPQMETLLEDALDDLFSTPSEDPVGAD